MTADFPVVLDACVLVPASLRDTLLRCAERRMYLPRWSNEILDELRRTLLVKLGRSNEQVNTYWQSSTSTSPIPKSRGTSASLR